jgi:hypothetical protein
VVVALGAAAAFAMPGRIRREPAEAVEPLAEAA